ncbi:hypothetical protein [Priestia flexa]|uniref:hypothetical protein n=1 Tax=Priestia flexa TaxID=86664 RepID=UPI00099D4F1D|nr:hypothetical protein [Priestia flexa]AQX56048.1 hypothetical protein BC359_18210 [Priestia flexa]
MLPIHYGKKTKGRVRLNSRTLTPIRSDSAYNYTEQRQDEDRRQHFGDSRREDLSNNNESND